MFGKSFRVRPNPCQKKKRRNEKGKETKKRKRKKKRRRRIMFPCMEIRNKLSFLPPSS